MTVLDHPRPVAVTRPGRLLALMAAAVLFTLGWLTAKTVLTVAWGVTAVRLGWDDAHRIRRPSGGT